MNINDYYQKVLNYILFYQSQDKAILLNNIIQNLKISHIAVSDYGEYVHFYHMDVERELYFDADIENEAQTDGAVFILYCFKAEYTFLEITSCVGLYSRECIEKWIDDKTLGA